MIDTIHIRLDAKEAIKLNLKQISHSKNLTDSETGELLTQYGQFKGLYIRRSDRILRIEGSLSEYYFGNNIHTLTLLDIREAINKISVELNIDLQKGKVVRLDLAGNLKASLKVKSYFQFLGEKAFFSRSIHGSSLYYTNENRKIVMYDKIRQIKAVGQKKVPDEYMNANLARFEVRYMSAFLSSVMEQFGKEYLLVEDLLNPCTYKSLINRWEQEYTEILKVSKTGFDLSKIKKVSDLKKFLALLGIEKLGGVSTVLESIDYSKVAFKNQHPVFINRLKGSVKALNQNTNFTFQSREIIELDKRVKEVKRVQMSVINEIN